MLVSGLVLASCDSFSNAMQGKCTALIGSCDRKAAQCGYDCLGAGGDSGPCNSICR
jgi:hypothetical protein